MFRSTDVILALGRRGCGKSFLAKNIQKIHPRRIIFDTVNEYSKDSNNSVVYNFNEFADAILRNEDRNEFEIIFQFDPEEDNPELIFDQALKVLYYRRDVLIVIEEVQTFSSPHYLGKWLRNCLLKGRHQNLALLFTTQRPGELHKTILSQCSHIFAGQIHETNDLNYISKFIGVNSEKLINLKKEYFLLFSPGEEIKLVHNSLTTPKKLTLEKSAKAPTLETQATKTETSKEKSHGSV